MNAAVAVFGSITVFILVAAAFFTFLYWKRRAVYRNTILKADFSAGNPSRDPGFRRQRGVRERSF
jgi:hypothetical protein